MRRSLVLLARARLLSRRATLRLEAAARVQAHLIAILAGRICLIAAETRRDLHALAAGRAGGALRIRLPWPEYREDDLERAEVLHDAVDHEQRRAHVVVLTAREIHPGPCDRVVEIFAVLVLAVEAHA